MPGFDNGYAGVDVFFVLSGFLITSLIAREVWSTRRLDIVAFYARRMRRLLPAALLVLLVTAVLYAWLAGPLAIAENRFSFVAATLYFSNWYFMSRAQDYFAVEASPSPVLHYWSLSVEEQFYIVWPLVALVILIAVIARKGVAAPVVGILALGSIAILFAMTATSPEGAYFSTLARAYQLLIGAVLALIALRGEMAGRRGLLHPRPARALAAISALVLVTVCTSLFSGLSPTYVGLVSAFASVGLIAGLEYSTESRLSGALSSRVPRTLGRWSYSIYLWHWPVIVLAGTAALLPSQWWVRVPLVLAVTLCLAWLTWNAIEAQALSVSLASPQAKRRVVVAGLVAVLATAAAMPLILRVPASANQVIEAIKESQPDSDSTGTSSGGTTSGRKVLLVGDSHAIFWVKAMSRLAEDQGWQFMAVTRAGCPWSAVESFTADGSRVEKCDERLRVPALHAAEEFRPDVTILISRAILVREINVDGVTVLPNGPGWKAEVEQGSRDFLARLAPYTESIVIFQPIPETQTSMVNCLAGQLDLDACSLPAYYQPGTDELRKAWEAVGAEFGASVVTIDEVICPAGACPAVVDGVVTHRDEHHITYAYAMSIVEELDALLRRQGVILQEGRVTTPP
jgi:peptidoglycan/LPS O-acetylase OafA/YrhL